MEWVPVIIELPVQDEKTGDIVGMRKGISRYFVRFEDDEKKIIRYHLKRFPDNKVELFIEKLRKICEDYGYFLSQKRDEWNYDDVIEMLPQLEKALQPLIQLENKLEGKALPTPRGMMISIPEGTDTEQLPDHFTGLNQYCDLLFYVPRAQEALKNIINHLKKIKTYKLGNKKELDGGFAQAVANLFEETFKTKPSLAPDGNLGSILQTCLDGLGLPSKDPGRRLKKIRT